jgi:hypothetical protein
MTTALIITTTPRSLPRRLDADEVAELARLTRDLPHLRTALPLDLADAGIRLDAAVWELARRHDVDVCPTCSVLDVADKLASDGWSTGPARDALRALVMLRGSGTATTDTPTAILAAARLIGYLELRSRLG